MSAKAYVRDWTRSEIILPKHHIISHVKLDAAKFTPSYDKNCLPTDMKWLLGWEYGRLWLDELHNFSRVRDKKTKPKIIRNNYQDWMGKRRSTRKAAFV